MEIQQFDALTKGGETAPRIETGPVQFGDDWPGSFFRGDNASFLALDIRHVMALLEKWRTDRDAFNAEMESLSSAAAGWQWKIFMSQLGTVARVLEQSNLNHREREAAEQAKGVG